MNKTISIYAAILITIVTGYLCYNKGYEMARLDARIEVRK